MHLDKRLNWKVHVKKKRDKLNMKMRKIYWLIGRRSPMNLTNKRLIYQAILKPVWCYGLQIWGTTKKSNRLIIQRYQNKVLRQIADAPWYVTNDLLHRDLNVLEVDKVIRIYAKKHEKRLHAHPNITAIELLDSSADTRRLKRVKPHELV